VLSEIVFPPYYFPTILYNRDITGRLLPPFSTFPSCISESVFTFAHKREALTERLPPLPTLATQALMKSSINLLCESSSVPIDSMLLIRPRSGSPTEIGEGVFIPEMIMLVEYIEEWQSAMRFTSSSIGIEKGDLGVHSFISKQRK
jgi:hypothetical protein